MNVARLVVGDKFVEFHSTAEIAEGLTLLAQMLEGMLSGRDTWSEHFQYEPIKMSGQYIMNVPLKEAHKRLTK
jgi:hypothetical protein